jgi:3-phosphoshikimate 1-carboxyvinyltransferase
MFKTRFLDIPPLQKAQGLVPLPGSKSISNRVLLLAGLSAGTTVVRDVLASDDTQVMVQALRTLGCVITPDAHEAQTLHVTGLGGQLLVTHARLFMGNAGTAMRPLTAVLALLAATQNGCFELHGVPRMHERPIGDLVDALRQLGCGITDLGQAGFPPLRLEAAGKPLNTSQPITVRGDVSSQFLTALLLALPLVTLNGDVQIEVQGELISKPYVEITLNLLARFGVVVQRDAWHTFRIPQGSRYQSPGDVHIEGDASSASYFVALGSIAAVDAPVRIEGVGADSIQGDIRFLDAAQAMGAAIQTGPNWIEVRRGQIPLNAIQIDCNAIPDAAMTLAVMALFAKGTTHLSGIASWRVKETDRIAAMACELRKLGADVGEGPDWISITPPTTWQAARIHTYDDHRMAMCFSLAALGPKPVRILDPQCVAKTYPDYFEALFSLAEAEPANIPVITIDGPSASGKGTLAHELAHALGYHWLDSGLLYRATALAALDAGILTAENTVTTGHEAALIAVAEALDLRFAGEFVWLSGQDVSQRLRDEDVGSWASQVSALAGVRAALHQRQLAFRQLPGLVADGRDMGTVVFADAPLKIFLTASAATRAERRHKQLEAASGGTATIANLQMELEQRDLRDQTRKIAPLAPADGAVLLDNSTLDVPASLDAVLQLWQQRQSFS